MFQIYDADMAAAEPTDNAVFGTITIKTPDVRLAGVDETISLGTDYLKKVDLTAPDATSTSTRRRRRPPDDRKQQQSRSP